MSTRKFRITRQAYLWTSLLKAPFWGLYILLPFILKKGLSASLFEITVLLALYPAVSIFSVYWSAFVHKRPDRLRSNLLAAGIIAYTPFFFFPYVDNSWFYVFAGVLFMMLKRGVIPAWMEILKLNLPKNEREKFFSSMGAFSYAASALLPIFFARWMDGNPEIWRYLFPLTALMGLSGIVFQWRIPIDASVIKPDRKPLKEHILKPWKESWQLFQTRADFVSFQLGFMLGGGGLMVMQPAMQVFFDDTLKLSYTSFAIAIAFCKGMGYAATSRAWARLLQRMNIYRLCALVVVLAAIFPALLLMGQLQVVWIFAAYLLYGIMQGGSELSWHMSGPIFSKDEDSSPYSSVNVVLVGLRGLVAPFIGAALCALFGSPFVLLLGSAFCILASLQFRRGYTRHVETID